MTPREKLIVASGLLFLAVVLGGPYVGNYLRASELSTTKEQGETIVAALERYLADQGALPTSLGGLVPEYLPSIPRPAWGDDQWTYEPYSPGNTPGLPVEEFDLGVGVGEDDYPGYWYDRKQREWYLDS